MSTATTATTASGFGTGPLSRAAALLHTLLTIEGLLLATAAPGLVGLLFLGPEPANLPLAACCRSARPCPPRCTPCITAAATSPTSTRPAATCVAGVSTPSPR
ncbi:hypothetical protein OV320_8113 [Actinobacteria bacterium OV320]|nr:hypothetical protein OV320_8113 [Actinobacteria bacterium OV320]